MALHDREPEDVYSIAIGSSSDVSAIATSSRAPRPTMKLEPCVALMGYDAARSKAARDERGW